MAQAKSSLQCEQWIGDTVKKNYKTRCIIHQQNIVSSFFWPPSHMDIVPSDWSAQIRSIIYKIENSITVRTVS